MRSNDWSFSLRGAKSGDAAVIRRLILELAEYEHLVNTVRITEKTLQEWMDTGQTGVLLAENGSEVIGFALYYFTFPTFRGQRGLYIEDIYVRPAYRGSGVGTALFREAARIARCRHCYRIDWMVLDWNKEALAFYEKIGAKSVPDWLTYRLQDEALDSL
ncbi:MAG: GNAT family N-acetyltransferase [Planctomycetaceae bacterium]|jgi:GNAT superfamily N-acetyltransferase|nr:GNAT family N-acetyltransferase [Planctomycetaceae bacterium]